MKILECREIDKENYDNIKFIRIDPENLLVTIREIITSFSDMAWISKFDKEYIRNSYKKHAQDTAAYLAKKITENGEEKVVENAGEYVVSELARKALVDKLGYLDVPLAELFKEQVSGNPGFDFYSANKDKIIIFGEAKYNSRQNAYGKGMEQVDRFIVEQQDISDLTEIDKFFEEISLEKVNQGEKAYAVAFASKKTKSDDIIKGIMKNKYYKNLAVHKEIIYLAVNI